MNPLQSLQLFYNPYNHQNGFESNRCMAIKNCINYLNYLESKENDGGIVNHFVKDINAHIDEDKFVNYYFRDISDSNDLRFYLIKKILYNDLDENENTEFYNDLDFIDIQKFCDTLDFNEGEGTGEIGDLSKSQGEFENSELNKTPEISVAKLEPTTSLFPESVVFSIVSENKKQLHDQNYIELKEILADFENILQADLKPETKPIYVLPYYITELTKYSKSENYNKFKKTINKMVKSRIFIDSKYYNPIFAMYVKKGDFHAIQEVFKDMAIAGVKPNVECCGYVIELYTNTKHERSENEVIDTLRIFRDKGLVPNLFVCSRLINFFTKRNNKRCAFEVFDFMTKLEIKPNLMSYTLLIHLNALEKDYEGADELFETMKSQGIAPNKYVYNSMLTSFINQPNPDRAFEILKEMSEKGIYTNAWNYRALHDLFMKENSMDKASQVLSEMDKMELQPVKLNNHSSMRAKLRGDK